MLFSASDVSEISMVVKLCFRAHDGLFYLILVILLKNIYIPRSQRKKGQVSLSHVLQNIIKLYSLPEIYSEDSN